MKSTGEAPRMAGFAPKSASFQHGGLRLRS
jgi:hypothetical protein